MKKKQVRKMIEKELEKFVENQDGRNAPKQGIKQMEMDHDSDMEMRMNADVDSLEKSYMGYQHDERPMFDGRAGA